MEQHIPRAARSSVTVAQLYTATQSGRKFSNFRLFLQINNQSGHFLALPKWKIMTQSCPGAARANALNCGGVKYTHTPRGREVKGAAGIFGVFFGGVAI